MRKNDGKKGAPALPPGAMFPAPPVSTKGWDDADWRNYWLMTGGEYAPGFGPDAKTDNQNR